MQHELPGKPRSTGRPTTILENSPTNQPPTAIAEDVINPAIALDATAMAKATTIGLAIATTIPLVVGTAIAIMTLTREKEEKTDGMDAVTATLKMTTVKGNNTLLIQK